MVLAILLLSGVLRLFGVGADTSSTAPQPTQSAAGTPAAYTESQILEAFHTRFGKCLADLKVQGEPVFTPSANSNDSSSLGEVVQTSPGHIYTFFVGIAKTGNLITMPDSKTSNDLATVGC